MQMYIKAISVNYNSGYEDCFKAYNKEIVSTINVLQKEHFDDYNKFFNSFVILSDENTTEGVKKIVLRSEKEFKNLKRAEKKYWEDFLLFERPSQEFKDIISPFMERFDGIFVIVRNKLYYYSSFRKGKIKLISPHNNIKVDNILYKLGVSNETLLSAILEMKNYGFKFENYYITEKTFAYSFKKDCSEWIKKMYETDTSDFIQNLKKSLSNLEILIKARTVNSSLISSYNIVKDFIELLFTEIKNYKSRYGIAHTDFKGVKFVLGSHLHQS